MRFSHTVETTASAQTIWAIWTDVERWPEWDSELTSARLEGPFRKGGVGYFKPKSGPESQFTISQFIEGDRYAFTVPLPLCELEVRRFFAAAPTDGTQASSQRTTLFTHEVSFSGFSAFFFGFLLGKQFRTVLPNVMQSIKTLAES